MRFLVDENVPSEFVVALRREGHDMVWLAEEQRAVPDEEIWRRAAREDRVLVTADLDFPLSPPNPPGMLLLRGADRIPTATMSSLLVDAVRTLGEELLGRIIVVSPSGVRRRKLS